MSADRPLLSVVVALPGTSPEDARAAVAAVAAQTDGDWELVVAGAEDGLAAVLDAATRADARVHAVPVGGPDRAGGRAAALAAGVAVATGRYVMPLAAGERLLPEALALLGPALRDGVVPAPEAGADVDGGPDGDAGRDADGVPDGQPAADRGGVVDGGQGPDARPAPVLVHGDAQVASPAGPHPVRRPLWSPERLRGYQYVGGAPAIRTDAVRAAGGLRPELDGAEVHDLLLRVTEAGGRVVAVPHVVSWTASEAPAGPPASPDGDAPVVRAVQEHLDRLGADAWVTAGVAPGTTRIVRQPAPGTRVSVVIPTRGGHGLVWGQPRCFVTEAVSSVLELGGVPDVEIVVVYDTGTPVGVLDELRRLAGRRLVLVEFSGPFNFSAKCNLGSLAATGDVVVMLNDDVQVRTPGALAHLVAPLREPDVGMTGARLLYSDGRVQHAGHLHAHGAMSHAFPAASLDGSGLPVELYVNRECSGLTAACVALRRETYEEVGGMWESLPVNFNDVDLCRKVLFRGLRLVWLADVELYHFESRTRVPVVHPWELELVTGRWSIDGEDPYLPGHADLLERTALS